MDTVLTLLIYFLLFAVPLAIFYFIGKKTENNHYKRIREGEEKYRDILLIPTKDVPTDLTGENVDCHLVCGAVVVANDYFKSWISYLANLLGGRVKAYESLLERGRRAAVVRMKEEAAAKHAKCIVNVKFLTANIAGQAGNQQSQATGNIEIICFGTAVTSKES